MFYRLQTPMSELRRRGPSAIVKEQSLPKQPFESPIGLEYDFNFEQIACDAPSQLHRVYRAPVISAARLDCDLDLKPRYAKQPLDISLLRSYIFVSERAREVIESVDDFGHQFQEASIVSGSELIDPGQPFYHMHMRRFVSIYPKYPDDFEIRTELQYIGLDPYDYEELFFPTILENPDLREALEALPLWQHFTAERPEYRHHFSPERSLLYMNETLVRRLQQAGMRGIAEPRSGGLNGEFIAHV